jgi:hypothetical protein
MVAPTCFGITLPSSGSVPSAFWEMLNWEAIDRILWMGVLCLVAWCAVRSSRLWEANFGSRPPTFRCHIQESSRPETSVNVCQHMLRNTPKDRRPYLHAPDSLKSQHDCVAQPMKAILQFVYSRVICTCCWDIIVGILPARPTEGPKFDSRESHVFLSFPNRPNSLCRPPRLLFNR